jgi:ectoine hydroxylase-related dioxygenase (phytanoyl-CoA dioxygenase family)
MKDNLKKFNEEGFLIIKNFWTKEEINNFHLSFLDLLKMQCSKIGLFIENEESENMASLISRLCVNLEQNNRNAFNQLVQMQREMYLNSVTIFNKIELIENVSNLLNSTKTRLKIHQDGCLVNFPKNETRLYRYHSEQHYYPYRNNFLNIWFPLVFDKTKNNGTMNLKPKGHLRDYSQFSEFSGFSSVKGATLDESENLYQLDIPDLDLIGLETKSMELNVGDIVFFHKNMPHTSTVNNSNFPSFAYILRIYDFTTDRTLSNNNGVKRYSLEAARSGHLNFKV